jgi:hypothetical protein
MGTKEKNKKIQDYPADRNSADFPVSRCSISGACLDGTDTCGLFRAEPGSPFPLHFSLLFGFGKSVVLLMPTLLTLGKETIFEELLLQYLQYTVQNILKY